MNLFKAAFFIVVAITVATLVILLSQSGNKASAQYPVQVYFDHETGCQYVRAGSGITPRMNRSGKQLCEEKP